MNDDTAATLRRTRFGTKDLLTTYGRGRTCAEKQCETVLSQYNDDERCGLHARA